MKKAMFRLKELSREEGLQLVEEAKEKARRVKQPESVTASTVE